LNSDGKRIIDFGEGELLAQGAALDEFHDDEYLPGFFLNTMDGANMRVVQCSGSLGFLQESGFGLLAHGNVGREELERNVTVECGVVGFVDHAHSTLAKLFENLIVGYCLTNH
jgi:hypothetical protein